MRAVLDKLLCISPFQKYFLNQIEVNGKIQPLLVLRLRPSNVSEHYGFLNFIQTH